MSDNSQSIQKVRTFPILRLVLGLVYVGLLSAGLFFLPRMAPALLQVEHWTADWRSALFSDQISSQNPDIAVITISEETLADYPYRSPIDRGLLSELVSFADKSGAKAIGLDIIFDQPTEVMKDHKLHDTLESAGKKIVLGALDERVTLNERQRNYQTEYLVLPKNAVGYLNIRRESDGVIRYTAPPAKNTKYPMSFAGRMAEAAGIKIVKSPDRISWLKPPKDGSDIFLKIPAEVITKFAAKPEHPLSKNIQAKLQGKLVLIGADFESQDRHTTPLAKLSGEDMAGILVHAQILAQLIDGRNIHHLAKIYEWPILILIALFGLLLGWRFRLKRFDFLVGMIATFILIAADFFIYSQFRVILPFTTPFIAWVLGVTGGFYLGNSFKDEGVDV